VDAVEFGGEAEVGAVVHDELCGGSDCVFQFLRLVEDLARVIVLIAVLQEGHAAGDQFFSGGAQSYCVGKKRGVKNGVETWKRDHEGF
jgi:hypothetical protein